MVKFFDMQLANKNIDLIYIRFFEKNEFLKEDFIGTRIEALSQICKKEEINH